jgi:hypothetical protein
MAALWQPSTTRFIKTAGNELLLFPALTRVENPQQAVHTTIKYSYNPNAL